MPKSNSHYCPFESHARRHHGLEVHNVDIPLGWTLVILNMLKELKAIGFSGKIERIKSKFGHLCVYTDAPMSAETARVVSSAKESADHTCEFCGLSDATQRRRGSGWIWTACPECFETLK